MAELKNLIVEGNSRLIGDTNASRIIAENFIKNGGTASLFLRADGDVATASDIVLNGGGEIVHKAYTSNGTTATNVAGKTYGTVGNSTSGSRIFTKWFINLDTGVTTLTDGMIISFRLPTAGLATCGECITIDGNEQHFHLVVYNTASFLTTNFAVNSIITVQYDANTSSASYGKYDSSTGTYIHNGNTTTSIQGVWRVLSLYDSGNTDVRYLLTIYYPYRTVATGGAICRYTLCMMTLDGKLTSLSLTDNALTSTTKTMFSGYLDYRKVYYWNHTDNYAAGANMSRANTLLTHNGELIDYRYTFNCGTTLTPRSRLYLVGTIDNNGFKLDPTTPWSCSLPSSEDGKVYIYIGMVYIDTNAYRGTLEEANTVYWYKNGRVQVYSDYSTVASKLGTTTVGSDNRPIYLSNGIPTVANVNTSYLVEPLNTSDSITKTNMPLINTVRTNKLALLPASQIIIEKTTDGGTTWVDAGISNTIKEQLFLGNITNGDVYIPLKDGIRNKLCGIRITITGMTYNVPENTLETNKYNYWNSTYIARAERYCTIDGLYLWVSAANDKIRTRVYAATGEVPNNWVRCDYSDSYLGGWSGGNIISTKGYTFGGQTSQTYNYWNYRIELFTDGPDGENLSTTSTSIALVIRRIQGFGKSLWASHNNLIAFDHLYSWDSNETAIFPYTIRPNTNNSGNLGDSSYRWKNLYIGAINASGNITANGEITSGSDERLKLILDNINLDISDIAQAPSILFKWKDNRDDDTHIGSIAQYWDMVLPNSARVKDDGFYALNYGTTALICSIAEAKEIVKLKQEIIDLKKEIEILKNM